MSSPQRLEVRLTPRASKNEVVGADADGAVRIRVTGPPVDGAANKLLIKLLAKKVGVRTCNVRIVAGSKSRDKVVEVVGVEEEIRERLLSQD